MSVGKALNLEMRPLDRLSGVHTAHRAGLHLLERARPLVDNVRALPEVLSSRKLVGNARVDSQLSTPRHFFASGSRRQHSGQQCPRKQQLETLPQQPRRPDICEPQGSTRTAAAVGCALILGAHLRSHPVGRRKPLFPRQSRTRRHCQTCAHTGPAGRRRSHSRQARLWRGATHNRPPRTCRARQSSTNGLATQIPRGPQGGPPRAVWHALAGC